MRQLTCKEQDERKKILLELVNCLTKIKAGFVLDFTIHLDVSLVQVMEPSIFNVQMPIHLHILT